MTTEQKYTAADIVDMASKQDAVGIAAAFDELVGQRVVDSIEARKFELAQQMLNPVEDTVDDVEQTDPEDTSTIDAEEEQTLETEAA